MSLGGGAGLPSPRPAPVRLSRLLAAALALATSGLWAAAGQAREVPYFSPASDPDRQGFVRIANRSEVAGTVSIEAIDDAGTRFGPVALSIGGGETVHFNSDDLEAGNADKGLPDGVGDGSGAWRLEMGTDLDIEVLAYLRHKDGFLTAAHDLVPREGGRYRVPFFNPASNWRQVSLLRLTNPGTETATARIQGIDDAGDGGQAETTVAPGASRTLSAQDLEGMGLGDGRGKWQLVVDADQPLRVMSLLRSPTAHLTNLSTAPDTAELDDGRVVHRVPLVPAAGGNVQGFVRVINHGGDSGEATVRAIDDSGIERGTLTLALAGRQTVGFNSDDLARGNADRGLTGSVSAGEGDWRLEIESDLPIEVLAYARTKDGFVTSLHDAAPAVGRDRHVAVLNPGANWRQVSSLRLVNPGDEMAEVSIAAVDDAGESRGLGASALIPAGASATWTALELEDGTGSGLAGAIGDGAGKWRLRVTSRQPVRAMSLMTSPTGHLTNLSTSTLPPAVRQVALTASVEVPWGVGGVGEVTVASLGGDSAEAPADGSSSVLVASDDGGTVLLALADEDGGYLDGGSGSADVGIESTALALAAAASGRLLHKVERPFADAVRGHADFGRLVELLAGLMASDAHYLDRLYDYPDAVALVRAVATGAAEALAASGAGAAPGPVPVRVKRAFGTRAAPSGEVPRVVRDDFYCLEENQAVKVVTGAASWVVNGALDALHAARDWFVSGFINRFFGWNWSTGGERAEVEIRGPCSPWKPGQPWTWHGEARTLDINWRSFILGPQAGVAINLADNYREVAVEEASSVPFLAVSNSGGSPNGGHAVANPNYVSFAMEAHTEPSGTAGSRRGWELVPGNHGALDKLLSSGAAFVPVASGAGSVLGEDVAMVRLTRHRFGFLSDDQPEKLASWVNALDLGLAAANLLTNVGGVRQALRGKDGLACVRVVAEDIGSLPSVLSAAGDVALDTGGKRENQLGHFYGEVGKTLLDSLKGAVQGAATNPACNAILAKFVTAIAKSAAAAALKGSNPAGWVMLALDAANETLPTALGYFSPGAGGVTYHLEWTHPLPGAGGPYISRVSTTRPPAAQFAYEQGSGFEVALDASATEPGDSRDLTFEWRVGASPVGSGERLTHDFGEAGNYRVELLVRDGNGEKDKLWSSVRVTSGRIPRITSLRCAAAGEGRVRLSADFSDADGDIDLIQWCPTANCAEGEWTDSDEVGFVDEVVLDGAYGTHARVAVKDERNNRTESTCRVDGVSTPVPQWEAGEAFREALESGGRGPEMVVIPAGSFRMGCLSDDEDCGSAELPVHEVTIPRTLAVSTHEVTFDDYDRFTRATGREMEDDEGWGRGSRPVINVTWQDAKDYAAWLSSETGGAYRLLSEAEWEYAARAGTETKYTWGNDLKTNRANCYGCGSQWDDQGTAPVGSFAPNAFGLHDVHGNVDEWVEDCENPNYEGAPSDGSAWTSGECSRRVLRGGSWTSEFYGDQASLRIAARVSTYPELEFSDTGFRVARDTRAATSNRPTSREVVRGATSRDATAGSKGSAPPRRKLSIGAPASPILAPKPQE